MTGLTCAGCGDGWRLHEAPDDYGSGACTVNGCPCLSFRWLPPEPGDRGAYRIGYPRPRPRRSAAK